MRKLYTLVGLIMVFSLILSACGTTPAKTEAPVATEAAATAAVTETPAVELVLNPYIGSNKLDGNGVPPTFFDDVHIRKAFAYAFDWDTVINEVWNGEAVQSLTLALPGMPGYSVDSAKYSLDLEKSAAEFKLADVDKDGIPAGDETDGSDIWNMGFRLQMLYNTGNSTRQIYAEILQANLAQVNELFTVEVLGLPWPAYLAAQRAKKIPVMVAGWLEDIHDAHNWYQPYTTGTYGARQNMPDDLKAQFKDLLNQGVSLVDPAARAEVYYKMNQLYYDQVPGIITVLPTTHGYEQKWLGGRVLNPIFSQDYYAPMTKSADAKNPDTLTTVTTGDTDTLDPALSYDTSSGEIIQNIYETLIFYDGVATDKFIPQLATEVPTIDNGGISADGKTWTFKIRTGVKFHEGGDLTPSDVAYSLQRGILQGGYSSPQWLLAEPFLGVGNDDITMIVDEGASADSRETLIANDPAKLVAACETVKKAIVADDAAGTVTLNLASAWGPLLPTLANGWGSIMDSEWVKEKGGWDGSCDTWQNFYGMTSAEDPFSPIANGTGPYKLEKWTPGEETVMTKFDGYWGTPANIKTIIRKDIAEFGTRFSMLQQGDADIIYVPAEQRPQVDPLVGEMRVFDLAALVYKDPVAVCKYDETALGQAKFTACAAGEKGLDQPLRLNIGRPQLQQDVLIFNFNIQP